VDSDLEVAVVPTVATAVPRRTQDDLREVLARGRTFLPGIKRLLERCVADPAFIDGVKAAPLEAAADAGIGRDPREFRHLWDREFATSTSEPPPPIVEEYRRLLTAKLAFRDRAFAEARSGNARMAAWRDGRSRAAATRSAPAAQTNSSTRRSPSS
jgi:hypothetical protein